MNPMSSNFYIISVDIGRFNCNTAITVIKVLPREDKTFKKNIVYLEVINGENFITQQAPRIKELIELYNPREVVIDSNGVGAGLMDAMVVPSVDINTGKQYPAYFCFNNPQHLPSSMKTPTTEPQPIANAILYSLKADAGDDKNDAIHANVFTQIATGSVSFLASERIIKEKLLATKKGQKMDLYDRKLFLLPYEMTSRLVDEMSNLRLRPGVQNKLQVEQISSSINKDRFSSLEYGLWRVKHYEDISLKAKKRKINGKFAFFSPKTGVSG